jgi:hypothetical protein
MPPKKQDNKPKKDKSKVADDKTFGLKNKNKSTKVNKFVQTIKEQAEKAGDRKTLVNLFFYCFFPTINLYLES